MRQTRWQKFIPLFLMYALVVMGLVFWHWWQQDDTVQVAVAKNQQMYGLMTSPELLLDGTAVLQTTLADPETAVWLAGKQVELVNAVPLSAGEARYWQDQGCSHQNCAHLTLYNYTDGGTLNTILNLDTQQVVGHWADSLARPGGSRFVVQKAVAIAAADPQVQAILGQIGTADPAMIPMSGWLMDDTCNQQWCVDLTYHDPNGTGRIFHVFVNMEQEAVARTFYTRARADLPVAAPEPQRETFSDGCQEQYGWSVCWEMTAHDGVHFFDATFNGTEIFSSIKIGQIEAWYPSWPGGYRDEIGFGASVPPYGPTLVTDYGTGFEVRQLFTEFTHWPNCICCYRYEEIIRFDDDGSFEPRFVSHGPGCDDLSIYRPFWRIDLDLDGPRNDQVWYFQGNEWVKATHEFELATFVSNLSPEGQKIATFDGDVHYRWHMELTDPLGLDEAHFFALRDGENEGEGPVTTGPGDTYQPPRQWVDGDTLSGNDIVLWFVASLKTKKGGPWWCMPDPEPGVNECEAILHVDPAGELHQPTAEEIAQITPTATPTPQITDTPAPTPTPRPVDGETAEDIILNAGCGACHTIGAFGEKGKVGPDLSNIGLLAENRVPGLSAEAYIRQAIVEPNAYLAPECPNGACLANIMPQNYGTLLNPGQVEVLVAFLLQQRGEEVAVIGETAESATPAPKAIPAPKLNRNEVVKGYSNLIIQVLLVTLVFLLSILRLLRQQPT